MSLFLALALAAAAPPADTDPVVVTGHAWAPFISPMGEPFRSRSAGDDPLARWFAGADRDSSGSLSQAEMLADAERFFATLDDDGNGQIEPAEMVQYEWEIAPDAQLGSVTRYQPGKAPKKVAPDASRHKRERWNEEADYQGAARYGLLNLPQPVAAADYDFDRAVTLGEFRRAAVERFQRLDARRLGGLTLATLTPLLPRDPGAKSKRRKDSIDPRLGSGLPAKN